MISYLSRLQPRPLLCLVVVSGFSSASRFSQAPSGSDFPRTLERRRWNLTQATLLDEPRRAALLALLDRLPDEDTLCHGDFHLENTLLSNCGPVIIDWEGSMHGSPSGDVANTCLWFHRAFRGESSMGGWLLRRIGLRLERIY